MAALPSATLYTNFFAGGFHESLRNFATGCRHFKALRCKTAPAEAMHAEKRRQKSSRLGARDSVRLTLLTASVRVIRFEPLRVTNDSGYDLVQFTERGIRDGPLF
jgi:hypothetical protein